MTSSTLFGAMALACESFICLFAIGMPATASAQTTETARTASPEVTTTGVDGRLMPDYTIDEILNLSLENLQNVPVASASLTSNPLLSAPAAITLITEDDIRLTPARNLLDLVEIYVPGAQFRIHSEGLHPGFRGILSDRNLKFLLIVNGRVMNQLAHNGATTELENWDLNDIAQVEVVRGPGSVTYGPGAISAVINITTKNGRKSAGTRAHADVVSAYNSAGVAVEHGLRGDDVDVYVYASVVRSKGLRARFFGADGASPEHTLGIFGEEPALKDYGGSLWMNDTYDEPQIKAHVQLGFFRDWKLWARYTTQGTTNQWYQGDSYTRLQTGLMPDGTTPILGPPYSANSEVLKDRQFATVLENEHTFAHGITLKSMASYDTIDFRRAIWSPYRFTAADSPAVQKAATDPDSPLLYAQRFAEDKFLLRTLASAHVGAKTKLALGGSAEWEHWGPAWGDSKQDFRFGEVGNVVAPDSPVIGAKGVGAIDPNSAYMTATSLTANTLSAFGEAEMKLHPLFTLLVSGRVDKNSRTDALWSGRLVVSSHLSPMSNLRLIGQVAQRMNTMEQLILEANLGPGSGPKTAAPGQPDPEKVAREAAGAPQHASTHESLLDAEILFSTMLTPSINLVLDGYYNQVNVISFNGARYATEESGKLKLAGAEAELNYGKPGWRAGINHSYTALISWALAPGVSRSGISYADYNNDITLPDGTKTKLLGTGNNLNNWANVTKVYANLRIVAPLTLHVDGQLFWSYPGVQDQLDQLDRALAGTSEASHFAAQKRTVDDVNAAGMNVHVNASLQFQASESVTLAVYGFNLANSFRRYHQDAGSGASYVQKVMYMREPLAVGATLRVIW